MAAYAQDHPRDPATLRTEAERTLRHAAHFFREEVSSEGGYLWRYRHDLQRREGEARATATTIWVQAPGTPAVGQTFLSAYAATHDPYYLDSAQAAGQALLRGQLRSGGWDYRIEFAPDMRQKYAYRADKPRDGSMNVTTYDDNVTQGAVQFLIELDRASNFKDAHLGAAIHASLDSMLKSQYPNGAWPQRFSQFPSSDDLPVRPASYPDTWSREYLKADYQAHYTFNDNLIRDMVDTLLLAWHVYDRDDCRDAVLRAGDFILLAQMPDPQPGWAQQYDEQMHPSWARKFEPPAVTGGESQGVMRTLLTIYRATGERRFLEPVPRAVAYFRASQLPDGRLARFYELKTNRPLYFTKDYQLTYHDNDLPTHYGFKTTSSIDQIDAEYHRCLAQEAPVPYECQLASPPVLTPQLTDRAVAAIDALDEQGRWIEPGRLRYHGPDDTTDRIIDCATFNRHMRALADYLRATQN